MNAKRDCTRVSSLPDSVVEALVIAQTIENLVRDNILKPEAEYEIVNDRKEQLRDDLRLDDINSHVNAVVTMPLDGDSEKSTVSVEVTLIDHKLIFSYCCPN